MNSPHPPLIVTLCGRRARGQFFSFIQMMLGGGKCLLSKLLQIRIVPFATVSNPPLENEVQQNNYDEGNAQQPHNNCGHIDLSCDLIATLGTAS